MVSLASTADSDQESTVDITVDEQTQLDVRPSLLEYSEDDDGNSLVPGDLVTVSTNAHGFEHLDVENIGSQRIADIIVEASLPEERPFGVEEDQVEHDTGNFFQIGLETAYDENLRMTDQLAGSVEEGDDYDGHPPHYANRVEFFEENPPEYINRNFDESESRIGRIKEGDVEYFVEINEDDSESPDATTLEVRIGQAPHTSTQLGTTDFTDDDQVVVIEESEGGITSESDEYDYLEGSLEIVSFDTDAEDYGGEDLIEAEEDGGVVGTEHQVSDFSDYTDAKVTEYALFIHPEDDNDDEPHMLRTRFGEDLSSPADSNGLTGTSISETTSGQSPLFSSQSSDNQLQPGENFPADVGIELPQGVDQDAIDDGAITFFATTGESPS